MREQLLNDVVLQLSSCLETEVVKLVETKLAVVLNEYNVEKLSTEVAVCSEMPKCYEYFLATKKIEGLSDKTLSSYELRIRQFFTFFNKDINDITPNDIRVFLFKYQELHNVSNRTLDSIRTILYLFFSWSNAEGYCDKNPCLNVNKIKYTRTQKEALDELELEMFRNGCLNARDRAIVEFMYSTGARVSEVSNVKIKDLNLETREVTLLGKGNKIRTDYLNPKAILYIKEYLQTRKDDSPYLFVGDRTKDKISKGGLEYIIDCIWKASGLKKKVTPHIIRHTTATLALKRGMGVEQVQKILGHSNINTTMIYAEVLDTQVKQSHSMAII